MADAILASGIYCITNTVNGKVYIGSAIRVKNRFRQHKSDLNLCRHANRKLQRAWNKYGQQSFEMKVIEPVLFPEDLIDREQYWIDRLNSVTKGYNILPKAGSCLGSVMSAESKAKMSLAKKGRPSGRGCAVRFGGIDYPTIEAAAAANGRSCSWVRVRLSSSSEIIQSPNSRPPMTDASRRKMSQDRVGVSISAESIAKQLATKARKSQSEKARSIKKNVAARAARTPEERAETKAKLIATRRARGCVQTPESIAKMLATKNAKSQSEKDAVAERIRAGIGRQSADRKAEIAARKRATVDAKCAATKAEAVAKMVATKSAMSKERKAEIVAKMLASRYKTLSQKAANDRPAAQPYNPA